MSVQNLSLVVFRDGNQHIKVDAEPTHSNLSEWNLWLELLSHSRCQLECSNSKPLDPTRSEFRILMSKSLATVFVDREDI